VLFVFLHMRCLVSDLLFSFSFHAWRRLRGDVIWLTTHQSNGQDAFAVISSLDGVPAGTRVIAFHPICDKSRFKLLSARIIRTAHARSNVYVFERQDNAAS